MPRSSHGVCDDFCFNSRLNHLPIFAKSPGFFLIGVFLCFGAAMSGVAAFTLLWPGTILENAWALNAGAYERLAPFRSVSGPLFLLLSLLLVASAFGWFRQRQWGWKLAVVIIAMQVSGDIINLLRGDWLHGLVGVTLAGGLLLYLFAPSIRAMFPRSSDQSR